jgi:hypothetical protein
MRSLYRMLPGCRKCVPPKLLAPGGGSQRCLDLYDLHVSSGAIQWVETACVHAQHFMQDLDDASAACSLCMPGAVHVWMAQ